VSDHHDVIVIGSGAGGEMLVRHLAPSGKRILLLERGGWLPREPQHWLAGRVHAYLKNEIPVAGVAHQAGTCRFGTDPDMAVLDEQMGATVPGAERADVRA
jgi:choline dehydrogenase-like flavoprotein